MFIEVALHFWLYTTYFFKNSKCGLIEAKKRKNCKICTIWLKVCTIYQLPKVIFFECKIWNNRSKKEKELLKDQNLTVAPEMNVSNDYDNLKDADDDIGFNNFSKFFPANSKPGVNPDATSQNLINQQRSILEFQEMIQKYQMEA